MAGSMVGSSHLTEVREYSGLADAEKKTGLETGMPESFSNGYQFQYVNTGDGLLWMQTETRSREPSTPISL